MNNNETTTQVTRKRDKIREDLNNQILEVIDSAIAETVLPSFQNVVEIQKSGLNSMRDHRSSRLDRSPADRFSNVDRRSGRLDTSRGGHFNQMDHRPRRLDKSHCECFSQLDQQDCSKLNSKFNSHTDLNREISVDSQAIEQDCDMVTGANPTPRMVPEFLTGRPMQSQEPMQNPESTHSEYLASIQPLPGTSQSNTTTDPINILADILVGINNRPSTQTLTVCPFSSTTLKFDGKSDKFSLLKISSTQ